MESDSDRGTRRLPAPESNSLRRRARLHHDHRNKSGQAFASSLVPATRVEQEADEARDQIQSVGLRMVWHGRDASRADPGVELLLSPDHDGWIGYLGSPLGSADAGTPRQASWTRGT